MQINISNIRQEINNLKKTEELYETMNFNYYNMIKNIENEWNSIYEKRLMEAINEEQKITKKMQNDMADLNLLYNFICEKYEIIGNNIMINNDQEDTIMDKINSCIDHLKKVIYIINSINTKEMTNTQVNKLNSIKYKIQQETIKLKETKNSISNIIKNAKKIENDIKVKILKTKIDIFKEIDVSDIIGK